MAKEIKPPPEEGLPAWMATFADMMTLLLTFFVLLLSFSNQDIQMFRDIMGSMQDAFGVRVERKANKSLALTPSYSEQEGTVTPKENKILKGIVVRIKSALKIDPEMSTSTGVVSDKDGVLVKMDSNAMFQRGSAVLTPEGYKFLSAVYNVLRDYKFNMVVRGHTDDQETSSRAYPTNWELSAARASATLRYILEKGGISPNRVKAVGYAGTRPLAPNDSDANRAKNNRVEFYIYRPSIDVW
jgi:chemotaxis protein MotB